MWVWTEGKKSINLYTTKVNADKKEEKGGNKS